MLARIKSSKEIIYTILVALLVMVLIIAALPHLSSDEFKEFINSIYPFGSLVIIIYIALTQILAPLPGSPGVIVSFAVFGWEQTTIHLYLGSLLSATVSFYIARHFGRKWVKKLAGKKSLNQIDEFAEAKGNKALIIGRLFGFPLFDYISYAAGFTNIPFRTYFAITAVFGGIANFAFMSLYRGLDFSTTKGFIIWYGSLLLLFPVFAFMIRKYLKFSKGRKKDKK